MTDDLSGLVEVVADFAAVRSLVKVPALPVGGPEVRLGPELIDLAEFLDLAARLGAGVLYSRTERFEPEADEPDHVGERAGQECELTVAFRADGGTTYRWEYAVSWYVALLDSAVDEDDHVQGGVSEEERERLTAESTAAILSDPKFRSATPGTRRRVARVHVLHDADSPAGEWVFGAALNAALDQAETLTADAYAGFDSRLDELAAQLAGSDEWRQARSAVGRKQATVRFLAAQAAGWYPPDLIRDEVYGHAQELGRRRSSSGGLF